MKPAGVVTCMAALVLVCASLAFPAQVEPPAVLWERTFTNKVCPQEIRETPEGDLVVAGTKFDRGCGENHFPTDFYIMRTDAEGNPRWERAFSPLAVGVTSNFGLSLCIGADRNYIIAGVAAREARDHDLFLLKISEAGELIWKKEYGHAQQTRGPWWYARVAPTLRGCYRLVASLSANDSYLATIGAGGDVVWEKLLEPKICPPPPGGRLVDVGWVAPTPDGGCAVAGRSHCGLGYLARLDDAGDVIWDLTLGNEKTQYAWGVAATSDGGFVLGGQRMWAKVDAEGKIEWLKDCFPMLAQVISIQETTDGGYLATGGGDASDWYRCMSIADGRIVKLDPKGDVVWQKDFSKGAVGRGVLQTKDGGYVAVGGFKGGCVGADDPPAGFRLIKLAPDSSPAASFQRGDASGDGSLEISDAIQVLSHLFQGGARPGCDDAADANDDGKVNITDPITVLLHLFAGAGPLPEPSAACGQDPTKDSLTCESHEACR